MNFELSFWFYWFTFCGIILAGYFLSASGIYWLLYSRHQHQVLGPQRHSLPKAELLKEHLLSKTVAADIKRSVISVICFAFGAAIFIRLYSWDLTRVYLNYSEKGLTYMVLSYILVLLLQDTFFYFTHRLFHLPCLFKILHEGHHQSRPPTPWTFLALEPMEAIYQAFLLVCITLIIPLHFGVILAVLVTMTVWSMGNHLGFQVIPTSNMSHWWGRWCIGATHHLVHHQYYNRHFGLYFTFWDNIFKTQDRDYLNRAMSQKARLKH